MKQNVLLAKTEHTRAQYSELLKGFLHAFTKGQGLFLGVRMNYTPENGFLDEPSKKGFRKVQNTVPEYLDTFVKTCGDHVTNLFNIEATNAAGNVKAPLIVQGKTLGEFSAMELLRLKSLLDEPALVSMYQALPVRSDTSNWVDVEDKEYNDAKYIYMSQVFTISHPTTLKESYVLKDPNIDFLKTTDRYTPSVATRDTRLNMGTQEVQNFSGEITHREKAAVLNRLTLLKVAVKEALVKANEAAVVPSQMTAEKIFSFLHRGE